jgi:hypothetical protein
MAGTAVAATAAATRANVSFLIHFPPFAPGKPGKLKRVFAFSGAALLHLTHRHSLWPIA